MTRALFLGLLAASASGCLTLHQDDTFNVPPGGGGNGLPSSCSDNVQDNDETDVDCGGATCDGCSSGERCRSDGDCQSSNCAMGRCAPRGSTCFDHVMDGAETAVDCGGGCAKCIAGSACLVATDCESGACAQGHCGAGSGPFSLADARFALTGKGASALAVADLDGDGRLDVASANALDNNVSVLLGLGDGTFRDAMNVDVGAEPLWIGAADLNADKRPDLVVLDFTDGDFSVLVNQGGGRFAPRARFSAPSTTRPNSAALGDLDHDGRLDVMVSAGSGALTLFSGRGDGSFGTGTIYGPSGISPTAMAPADLDGDGLADLAVLADMNLVVFHGGVAAPAMNTFSPGPSAWNVIAADLRKSGHADLVVTRLDGFVGVLAGHGDATFADAVFTNVGDAPFSVLGADLDGDGRVDLATGNQGSGDISLLAGHGDGTFEPAINRWIGGSLQQLVAADMNNDGKPDLVLCDYWQHDVGVMLNLHK